MVVINYWTLLIINLHEEHKQGWRVPATRKIHVTGDKSICKIRIHIIRSGWRNVFDKGGGYQPNRNFMLLKIFDFSINML